MSIDSYHSDIARTYKTLATVYMHRPTREILEDVEEELEIKTYESLTDIQEDFFRLFTETEEAVLPYESLYNFSDTEGPALYSSITQQVYSFYESCGLTLHEGVNFPADHIGLEFLFISYLIENEMLDELIEFFEEHVMSWVPEFCDRVYEKAQTLFFKEVAWATKEIVTADYEDLIYG